MTPQMELPRILLVENWQMWRQKRGFTCHRENVVCDLDRNLQEVGLGSPVLQGSEWLGSAELGDPGPDEV